MRPFIDLNNQSFSKETLIYYSRGIILMRGLLLIGLAIVAIYYLKENQFIISLLILIISLFQIPYLIKSLKRIDEIQFRINSKGIQYRDENLVPWNNIENERVITEYISKGDDGTEYFTYCIIDLGQVMKVKIAELNFDAGELQHTLTIHRNRYKRENNIV
jgi:hypothetical protein